MLSLLSLTVAPQLVGIQWLNATHTYDRIITDRSRKLQKLVTEGKKHFCWCCCRCCEFMQGSTRRKLLPNGSL